MKKNIVKLIFILIIGCFVSCSEDTPTNKKDPISKQEVKKLLLSSNKELKHIENEDISSYIKRYNLNMQQTKSGLYYWVIKHGSKQASIKKNDVVEFSYSIKLLNGIEVYSSKKSGNKTVRVGSSDAISGVNEWLNYLSVGDSSMAIIPSYLAYGLVGDDKKIPKQATLVYNIKILKHK